MSKATNTSVDKGPVPGVPAKERTWSRRTYSPMVDIWETPDELILQADMPGVSPDRIEVHFENGELIIRGCVTDRQPEEQAYLHQEYGIGDFYRVFAISEAIDSSRVSGEYKEGVLTLRLPKTEALKPRKIQVKAT